MILPLSIPLPITLPSRQTTRIGEARRVRDGFTHEELDFILNDDINDDVKIGQGARRQRGRRGRMSVED